jgi:TusA-related sulfurtransferase
MSASINAVGLECEEVMMIVRYEIKTKKMKAGDELTIQTQSKPFLSLLNKWAQAFGHVVNVSDNAEDMLATVTLA